MVSILNYKPCHVPLKYGYPVKKSDQKNTHICDMYYLIGLGTLFSQNEFIHNCHINFSTCSHQPLCDMLYPHSIKQLLCAKTNEAQL